MPSDRIETDFGAILLNPGTADIPNTSLLYARANMHVLLADIGLSNVRMRYRSRDTDGGRYGFRLFFQSRTCDIQMPGLPIERVRWMDHTQNIFDFPRLYINGSSWIWKIGIDIAREFLLGNED